MYFHSNKIQRWMARVFSTAELLNIAEVESERSESLRRELRESSAPTQEYVEAENIARDTLEEHRLLAIQIEEFLVKKRDERLARSQQPLQHQQSPWLRQRYCLHQLLDQKQPHQQLVAHYLPTNSLPTYKPN